MRNQDDDGKTLDHLRIAKKIEADAKKAGKPLDWLLCCSRAHVEVDKRRAKSVDASVASLNANSAALSVFDAAKELPPFDEKVIEADHRVAYIAAGYTKIEAVALAAEKLKAVKVQRQKDLITYATRINAARAEAGETAGTFARVDGKPKPSAPPPRYFAPAGATRSEIVAMAERGTLPIRNPIGAKNVYQVKAEALFASEQAAGNKGYTWEEAINDAQQEIASARKTAEAKAGAK